MVGAARKDGEIDRRDPASNGTHLTTSGDPAGVMRGEKHEMPRLRPRFADRSVAEQVGVCAGADQNQLRFGALVDQEPVRVYVALAGARVLALKRVVVMASVQGARRARSAR